MSIRSVMSRWVATFAVVILGSIAGCGGGSSEHAIDTSKYGKACVGDADCVAVYQGTLSCCGGGCPNTAIPAATYAQYLQDVAANTPVCNPAPPCVDASGACQNVSALCVGGLCTEANTSTTAISAR